MSELQIRKLHPALGAEVVGLEPRMPLDGATCRWLQQAFDEHSVLLFRDLDIDEDYQRYLVFTLIGEEPPATAPETGRTDADGKRKPMHISNKEDGGAAPYGRLLFHCDTQWAKKPQPVISLYGVTVEPPGGVPTQFVSMAHAWDTLPSELKARIQGLDARHGHDHYYPNRGGDEDVIDSYYEHPQYTVTPVAHRHSRTGRGLLYVSQQATIEILDLPEQENEALLAELFEHLYRPSDVLEHQWRKGDLVVWDNLAAQHGRGKVDLEGPERTLRKVFGPMSLTPEEMQSPVFSKVAQG